jgi:hypothetical protein
MVFKENRVRVNHVGIVVAQGTILECVEQKGEYFYYCGEKGVTYIQCKKCNQRNAQASKRSEVRPKLETL